MSDGQGCLLAFLLILDDMGLLEIFTALFWIAVVLVLIIGAFL